MTSTTARIYCEDQTDWSDEDYYALWRYFDRLAEYVGPTPAQAASPEHRSVRIQARKTSVRDEELSAIDVSQMPSESAALFRAVLRSHQRYELALAKFPSLAELDRVVTPSPCLGFDQYPPAVQALL